MSDRPASNARGTVLGRRGTRAPAGLLAAALAWGLLGAPAAAKEGVRARLVEPIPADAEPGSRIRVEWTLTSPEGAERRPFGASGVFVRLVGRGRSRPQEAEVDGSGRFAADVTVPAGGIERVEFGLRGWRSYPGGRTERADLVFPVEGRVFAPARPARGGPDWSWPAAPAAAGLLAALAWLAARVRARAGG